ncbi:MAG: alpha/beta fold hydrolase [Steroidobacteraceae bacterium]
MQQLERKSVQTGVFKTQYREAGSGAPLILIHGGGPGADSYGNWKDCFATFANQFHVYAYDMVGFGFSEAPDPASFEYSMDARSQQLIDFIKALGLRDVNVIGNSMGGATVLGAAMKEPGLIGNMVLMGSAGLTTALSPEVAKLVHYDFTLEGMRGISTALAHPGFKVTEEFVKYRYELTLKDDIRRATAAIQGWVKNHGGLWYDEADIARVKTRTLIFHGKNDKVVPVQTAYKFLDLLENSHGYILPDCGHWAMLEHPRVFTQVCLGFLSDR